MDAGLAASDEAPLAGQARGGRGRRRRRPMTRTAISAPAICGRTARATRTIRTPSCSTTTSPPSDPTRLRPGSRTGSSWPKANPDVCRVLCFSPRHDLTLARMEVADIERVVDAWVEETINLGAPAGHRLRPDLREPRRDHGLLEPASARPDLGDAPSPERAREGDALADRVSPETRPGPAPRLSRAGARARRAHRLGERSFRRARRRSGRSGRSRR